MLLTYGENAEIPHKRSVFYNQAYEALFQRHDATKGGFRRQKETELDIQDFSKVFALFCLQTYEKRIFKMSRIQALEYIDKSKMRLKFNFVAEDYLADLLSATCLVVEDGLEIMFTHRSFQEYFVAVYIVSTSDENQRKLLDRYWKYITSDSVFELVAELNLESIERNLLIPKLTRLFSEIQVSRTVGVSHAARYIKCAFSSFNFGGDNLFASVKDLDENFPRVLQLAHKICRTYRYPDEQYFMKRFDYLKKRYIDINAKESGDPIEFGTETMSYRSPLMRDILEDEGAFSLSYLRAGYMALRDLEKKHSGQLESLENLLDL